MKYEPCSRAEWISAGMQVISAGMQVILAGMQVILAGVHAGQWGVKLRPPASLEDRCSQV